MLTETIHPDCVAGVKATAALLADLGHEVVEATPPLDREPWLDAFVKIVALLLALPFVTGALSVLLLEYCRHEIPSERLMRARTQMRLQRRRSRSVA